MSHHYHGVGGAPGLGIGKAFRYLPRAEAAAPPADEDAAQAMARFAAAQQAVSAQLAALVSQLRAEGRNEEADILDAQALFVQDIAITDELNRRVYDEQEPLQTALPATMQQLRASFEALDDAYLRERAADIDAIANMLCDALRGQQPAAAFAHLPADAVIIAEDLNPAETAALRGQQVVGFATAHGGPTGHTAILARALGIPAVVGMGQALLQVPDATEVILDGNAHILIADPDPAERSAYQQQAATWQATRQRWQARRSQPGQTADGQRVALWANIGHPDEARLALEQGAEGIGLFRSEFLFLNRAAPPGEDEQYEAYCRTLDTMQGRPVVVRTLDVGGDRPIPYLDMPVEANPFLGTRGLRFCMRQPHLLQTQLRALLRAAAATGGNLRIMLPMIATLDDMAWGRAQLAAAAASLAAEGLPHRDDVPLGIMVETPAAAITADLLAQQAAFLSVGSNDLTQYTLAVDRGIAELAAVYPHSSVAVLRLIERAASAARRAGIPIGICGELAAELAIAPLLVGMGVDELSMAPAAIPAVKERLQTLTLAQMQEQARRALQ